MFAVDSLRDLATHDKNATNANPDLVKIRAAALFAQLKAANRAANTATRQAKDATAAARQEMDQSHLGLQNLLYEKRHLEREIEKCRQFASVYQDVPLHPLDQYAALAPAESTGEETMQDEHQLMLQRLNFELAERQRLEARRKELVQAKEDLLKQSRSKAATLDTVRAHIDTLTKSATDIQKKVNDLVASIPTELSSTGPTPAVI